MSARVIFFSFHLPLANEPGAFRPWMEARLLRDLGHEVTVITSAIQYMTGHDLRGGARGWCVEEMHEGVRILRVAGLRDYRRNLFRRVVHYLLYAWFSGMAALIRCGRAECILVGTDPIFVTPVARWIARIKRADLLLDERDLYPETAIALGVLKPGLRSRLIARSQAHLRRQARAILAATPGILRRLEELGVGCGKVRVLYNADVYLGPAETERELRERARARLAALAPPGAQFVVVYAGGMGRANDIDTLLDTAALLRWDEEIGFVLMGDGERRAVYEQRIAQEALRVRIIGALPQKEARAHIAAADLCVHLYLPHPFFSGALASKFFDYLALGRPVVFAGYGDTVAILEQAQCGIACRPGNAEELAAALADLKRDPHRRECMGRAARTWYENHVGLARAKETMAWLVGPRGADRKE